MDDEVAAEPPSSVGAIVPYLALRRRHRQLVDLICRKNYTATEPWYRYTVTIRPSNGQGGQTCKARSDTLMELVRLGWLVRETVRSERRSALAHFAYKPTAAALAAIIGDNKPA